MKEENPANSHNDPQLNMEPRRGFLVKGAAAACGAAALAVPTAAGLTAMFSPWVERGQAGEFVRLALLETLPTDGAPLKVPVIARRSDAWTQYPPSPIGAVFVRRVGDKVEALQACCPHAGCTIGFQPGAGGGHFTCPCHAANFDLAGRRTDASSFSPRDMDTLEVELRGSEVWVKFQNFRQGTAAKIALG